jgi:hypothetical protein
VNGWDRRRVWAAAGAVLAAVLAVGAALLALDVDGAHDAIRDGDLEHARGEENPAAWEHDAIFPGGAAENILGVSDDVEFRRAVALFGLSRAGEGGTQAVDAGARDEALPALTAAAAGTDGDARAAQAANLAGILAAEAPAAGVGAAGDEAAAELFRSAIMLDPGSEHAQRNLERLLRAMAPVRRVDDPSRERGREGRRPGGAGLSPPGEGY